MSEAKAYTAPNPANLSRMEIVSAMIEEQYTESANDSH